MLKALTIENFKGIKEPVRIEFRPINILLGPNSSGKSTIVHALFYAREILKGNLDPKKIEVSGETIDLGGFNNFVHGQNIGTSAIRKPVFNDIRIKLEFDVFNIESAGDDEYRGLDWLQEEGYHTSDFHQFWNHTIKNPWLNLTISYGSQTKKPFLTKF